MMSKKRIKKKILKKLTVFNVTITVLSILVSFWIVNSDSPDQAYGVKLSSFGNLIQSTSRIADAFDFYNQKRFDR